MEAGVLIGAAVAVAASGVFPWINGEAVVVGAALLTPDAGLPVLVLLCACSQMAAKSVVYGLVRCTPERMPARARRLLAKAERMGRSRGLLLAAILSGSFVAIPPFYLVTLACATLRVPFVLFATAGLGGTLTRYGLLAWAAAALGAG